MVCSMNGFKAPGWTHSVQIIWDKMECMAMQVVAQRMKLARICRCPQVDHTRSDFNGQHLTNIMVSHGSRTPPTSTEPFSNNLVAAPDGSYWVTDAYLEIRWNINIPVDLNTTPIFQSFCITAFTPTPTYTPTATFTPTSTETLSPTATYTATPTTIPTNYALSFLSPNTSQASSCLLRPISILGTI